MRRMIYRWLCKRAYRKGLRAGRGTAASSYEKALDMPGEHAIFNGTGPLAQRLEQGTHNPLVQGSNP